MIGAGLAPREVEREARRLLPHLRRAALSPTERGDFRAGAGPRADRRLVEALAARGLIVAQAGGTYALSVEGEAFLRRAGGGETAFLAQHAELTREGDALRARAVDAIEWLQARGLLTDAESDAAARLRRIMSGRPSSRGSQRTGARPWVRRAAFPIREPAPPPQRSPRGGGWRPRSRRRGRISRICWSKSAAGVVPWARWRRRRDGRVGPDGSF